MTMTTRVIGTNVPVSLVSIPLATKTSNYPISLGEIVI